MFFSYTELLQIKSQSHNCHNSHQEHPCVLLNISALEIFGLD